MTLIQRMTRLFKADLHGVLDCLEEPEEVVKQTIRDMEEALTNKEQTLTELHAALQRLAADETAVTRAAQEIEHRIDLCFQAGNEVLAKHFIRQRLETERRAKQLARAVEEIQARRVALEHTIAEQREQLAAVVQQLNMFTETRQRQAGATSAFVPGQGGAVITDDDVEVAFLEEKRRRAGSAQAG
ncbi:MAG: PspA/IM30 family protein [Nitrospinae bacterium]|nr:PspA/IM30 family protein [Nitrospinota bacterium]